MKKLISLISIIFAINSASMGQPPMGPPPGNQTPDIIIPVSTLNTNLVYRVNGRDGRLYQAYLGAKLSSTNDMEKVRDEGHLAYPTFGTDNLF